MTNQHNVHELHELQVNLFLPVRVGTAGLPLQHETMFLFAFRDERYRSLEGLTIH
jgi:hypothetical protein